MVEGKNMIQATMQNAFFTTSHSLSVLLNHLSRTYAGLYLFNSSFLSFLLQPSSKYAPCHKGVLL